MRLMDHLGGAKAIQVQHRVRLPIDLQGYCAAEDKGIASLVGQRV